MSSTANNYREIPERGTPESEDILAGIRELTGALDKADPPEELWVSSWLMRWMREYARSHPYIDSSDVSVLRFRSLLVFEKELLGDEYYAIRYRSGAVDLCLLGYGVICRIGCLLKSFIPGPLTASEVMSGYFHE